MFKSLLPWKHTKTKVMVPEQTMEDERILQAQRLVPCSTCGRTFLPLPLKKHAPVCEKNASKKRKVFDSLKQRVEGTDLAQFHQKSYLKRTDSQPKPVEKVKKPSQWEENHQKLVDAIRSAKGATREMSPTKKQPPTSAATSNERCPHCDRQFGLKAFDRHVEWCKEHRTRIQKSPANVLLAKERLEARTKYKVPPLNKSKKTTVKEKYSSGSIVHRTESICSVKSTPPSVLKRTLSVKKPRSVLDLGRKVEMSPKVVEKTTTSTPIREKKTVEAKKSNVSPPYDPFISAERQFMELLECDNIKPSSTTTTPLAARPHTTTHNSIKAPAKKFVKSAGITNKKRASVIDPPACFQDSDAAEDDFEILENLINDQFNNENRDFYSSLNKQNKDEFNVILNKRKYSDTSSVDSSLINETDNLSIPEHFKFANYSPDSSEDTDITIQNDDVDLYSVQYDKKIEPQSNTKGSARKSTKTKTKSNSSFGSGDGSQVKNRAKTVEAEKTKEGKNAKTKRRDNNKLSESPDLDLSFKPEDLFAVDDKMYAEYKIYEEMYLKEKEQTANTKKHRSKNQIKSYGIELVNEESSNLTNKVSDDSAYGSLNRNSPKPRTTKLSPLRQRMDSASSSGSEVFTTQPVINNQQRMSRFCHECGNKYPLATAKFCPECGVKRLLL